MTYQVEFLSAGRFPSFKLTVEGCVDMRAARSAALAHMAAEGIVARGLRIDNIDWQGLDVRNLIAVECDFRQQDIRGADFSGANLSDNCRFDFAVADATTNFAGVKATTVYFDGASMIGLWIGDGAHFVGCRFRKGDFREWAGISVEFTSCNASGSTFASARVLFPDVRGLVGYGREFIEFADCTEAERIEMSQVQVVGIPAAKRIARYVTPAPEAAKTLIDPVAARIERVLSN